MGNINEIKTYWDRRPCNIAHSLAPVGSEAWSREVTERKYFVEPHIPQFAQFWRWCGKSVLEIGCGIGTDTLEFVRSGARVNAIDLSRESINLARRRCFDHDRIRAQFFEMDAEENLPHFRGNGEGYDLVYSFGVLHHTPHPERVLARAHAKLAPGGELRIMVYAKRSLKNFLSEQPEAQAGCPLVRRYSRREIRALLT